ncbi:4-hydroxy-3-methylbut-2-enyl diphosphate reductase [Geothrix sp. 21YS21S-2]|uniref:4-hydroxy-3-methylbut-2-enyl diphosphate reductase n=1 Tax=Geothrix sp. 21YS21S-2 TaxID=3068893 RepID=UPI0027B91C1D|nr:4-hydroxy-3-methylbut-2-enyl diphosphate reductase [Geothrix sp. 21YS21S-2]
MKVIVAKTAGFCWGVRRAMDAVLEASTRSSSGPVQTLGPLIHNPQALELIGRRGVSVAAAPEEVASGTVVIRAHGIPIQSLRGLKERQQRGELTIVNATCPEVAKVHSKIKKWSPKGYFTVILGTHGHAESVAHQSFADSGSAIVANMDEARALPDEVLEKVLVVAQTTFTTKDFQEISEYIRGRSKECIAENTICEDTWTRQEEARNLARTVDYVIVVGGRASSNTKHLAELAVHYGKPVQYVETAAELDLDRFDGIATVGVMAGASTPTWLVEEVVDILEQHGKGPERYTKLLDAAFGTPMKLAVGAAALTLGVHAWTGLPPSWKYAAITALYVLTMFLLAPYLNPLGLGSKGPARARILERNRTLMVGTALAALTVALVLAATLGLGSLLVVAAASVFGMVYKRKLQLGDMTVSIQAIPGSKDILVPAALAVVALALPLWHHGLAWGPRVWAGILLVAVLGFARTTLFNLKDMQNDQILGKETLPIVFGRRTTKILLLAALALAGVAVLAATMSVPSRHGWIQAGIILVCLAYPVVHLWLFQERFSAGKPRFEPWVELSFYMAGLLALF